jgi:membrane protease YdiL (CAAX protease family)
LQDRFEGFHSFNICIIFHEFKMKINILGYLFLLVIGIYWPLRSYWALRKNPIGKPITTPKSKRYAVGITITIAQTAFAFLTAWYNPLPKLFGSSQITASGVLATIVFLAITLGTLPWLVKHRSAEWRMRFYSILPETARQRTAWVFICLIVAVGEEVLYRAVAWGLLYRLTGNYWIAGVIAALVFGLNHLVQGWISTGIIFFIGLGFHLLILISGGLYAAIAAHFIYDLCAGLIFGRLAQNEMRKITQAKDSTLSPPLLQQ